MIELQNVTKIYRGRHGKQTVALCNVSFTLPERGMVFIVGKSGCGKSTLLNVIGGGDRLTEGEIIVDGNPMSAFTARDYDDYRNGVVGLIFQDYCLLDGLTVRENVALALQLAGEENEKAVMEAIGKVGLEEKAESYPSELSGGQKQRAAIARVLVKDTKYILADEPTGNLDSGSSRIVLELLKELSKTRLVLIVSHNRADADEFADRIIELSDGQIIGDRTRNIEAAELAFSENQIIFQRGHNFTEEELDEANRRLESGGVLRQIDTRFSETPALIERDERLPFAHKRISRGGAVALFRLFSKKRMLGMALSALTIVFLFVVLGVCQFFTKFDANAETARIMEEQSGTVFAMRKGYLDRDTPSATLDTSRLLHVPEEDIAAFREAGYKGNIFPLYNVAVITGAPNGGWQLQGYSPTPDSTNYGEFFCYTALGVLQVTEEYLTDLYGKEGKLHVLSGEISAEGDGVIVTDYFADSILIYNVALNMTPEELAAGGNQYAKLTSGEMLFDRYRVSAVIDTGYRERYAPLIEAWQSGKNIVEAEGDLALKFYGELNDGLNLAYTFNPNFMAAYNEDGGRNLAYFGQGKMEADGKTLTLSTMYAHWRDSLKEDEILLNRTLYCQLVGKNSTDVQWEEVKGKKIKLSLGDLYANAPNFEREFTVADTFTSPGSGDAFYLAPGAFKALASYSTYAYALYFDDVEGAMRIYDRAGEMDYYVQSPIFSAMYSVSKYASVFIDLFDIIIWTLYALVALTLLGFAAGSVKKCIYEIGVLRAMGAKTHDLVLLFVLQMVLVSAAVCLLAGLGLWFGAGLCNTALAEGFVAVTKNAAMAELQFINFSWTTVLMDAGIVFGLTALCAVVPLLLLHRIKPREIIRAKE